MGKARELVLRDALAAGMAEGERLTLAYGAAAYRGCRDSSRLGVGRLALDELVVVRLELDALEGERNGHIRRQAIPMVWDYAEGNVWCKGPCELTWELRVGNVCSLSTLHRRVSLRLLTPMLSSLSIHDDNTLISTDPSYYDISLLGSLVFLLLLVRTVDPAGTREHP